MDNNLQELYKKVYEFHGHVCLMSTAGIRIALSAMSAIDLQKSEEYLFAFYHARTCAIDPIQFITGCTLGNSNIIVDDEKKAHTLHLVRQDNGFGVTVTLKDDMLKKMKSCMMIKKGAVKVEDENERLVLMKSFDEEFLNVLNILKNSDTADIIDVTAYQMDIKPYLRF
ncbi:FmdE family protein [Thermodesulfobacteriota bacterium]